MTSYFSVNQNTKLSFKKMLLGACMSSFLLVGCETSWLGEDNDVPLEGERIPLFQNTSATTAAVGETIDVSANLRDPMPMRDVTPAEAAAIAATEAALRDMENELRTDSKEDEIERTVSTQAAKAAEAKEATDALIAPSTVDFVAQTATEKATQETADALTASKAATATQRAAAEIAATSKAGSLRKARVNVADATVVGGFVKPPVWPNEFWPQVGGYGNHAMQHVAFRTTGVPKKIWSKSIGSGASSELPLTASPIVVDGKIFTLDSRSEVRAFDIAKGVELWRFDAGKKSEDETVIGGGLAFSGGRLYVTNGFNEIMALDPYKGEVRWRTALPSPTRAAPSAITGNPGKVFVSTLDNQLLALNIMDGSILWSHRGLASDAGLLGSASPAVNRDIVVPAYSSGEIYALNIENGNVAWSHNLSSARRSDSATGLTDIRALPVIDKGMVIAMSYADKLAAIDERTGKVVWEQPIGGAQTPWVAGNRLFVVDKNMKMYGLNRSTGDVVWTQDLPAFKKPSKKTGSITWYGPILAGQRLMVFSDQGQAMSFAPSTGLPGDSWDTGVNVVQPPVIADGRLILLSTNGTLAAFE